MILSRKLPDEIRAADEKAKKGSPGQGHARTLEIEKNKLVFNCKEYASEDAMPQEERERGEFPESHSYNHILRILRLPRNNVLSEN